MNTIEIYLSSKRAHLIFTAKYFQDGIEVHGKDKVGILAIENPSAAEDILAKAKTMAWELGDEPDQHGFFTVTRVK